VNREQPKALEATPEQIAEAEALKAATDRELRREKQYVDRFSLDVKFETVRGVTVPIEPGSSRLRIEVERRKALKRMRGDDRNLARITATAAAVRPTSRGSRSFSISMRIRRRKSNGSSPSSAMPCALRASSA